MSRQILDEDLVRVSGDRVDSRRGDAGRLRPLGALFWGDEVDFVDDAENEDPGVRDVRIRIYDYQVGDFQEARIRERREGGRNLPLALRAPEAPRLLEVTFVDVRQGDATFIRTPAGRRLLIDGGEESFIARLLASVSPGTSARDPLRIDALVISHGDAEHFSGLAALAEARHHPEPRKQLHVRALRVYHSGLVLHPEKVRGRRLGETERLGATVKCGGEHFATDLFDDPRRASVTNAEFARWKSALGALLARNGAVLRRVCAGDHDAFDFLAGEGIEVLVLGPVEESPAGRPALRVLRDERGAHSASHTINGQSVILKLRYGNVRMLLGGALDAVCSQRVLDWAAQQHPPISLESEIFKLPDHGSHEVLHAFLKAVAPVASVVPSGEESPAKEHLHPRANLLAALGRYSRGDAPLLFSTGLAASFAYRDRVPPEPRREPTAGAGERAEVRRRGFHAFERVRFGVIRVRTDGARVLVAPECASDAIREAYAFRVGARGEVLRDACRVV